MTSSEILLEMLTETAKNLNRHRDLDELLHAVVDLCLEAVGADSCFVYLLEQNELVLRASSNAHPEEVGRLKMRIGEGITGWVAQQRRPVALSQHAADDGRFKFYSNLPEDRFEAFLSVPILFRNQVLGVVNLQHRSGHEHAPEEIKAMQALGQMVGAAIEAESMRGRAEQNEAALVERKLVERAKGLLQKQQNLSEEDAYRLLQQESRRSRRSMAVVAQTLLAGRDLKTDGLHESAAGHGNGTH